MTRRLARDVFRSCQECGSHFYVTKNNYKKIFCSSSCADKCHNRLKGELLRDARNRCSNHDSRVTEEDS